MTGANLAPDTAREISGLKRRVTDLERMLDRVRRGAAKTPAAPLAPFAAFEGTGYDSTGLHTTQAPWRYYRPSNTIGSTVSDPTGHIAIEAPWTFRIDITGVYEVGTSVIYGSNPATHHYLGIHHVGVEYLNIVSATAPTSIAASLSGSRVDYSVAGATWTPVIGDDGGQVTGHECRSFWCRLVSTGRPIADDDIGSF